MGKIFTALGLMSGTSLDGVDVSIIESDGNKEYSRILDKYFEYDTEIIEKLLKIRSEITSFDDLELKKMEISSIEKEVTLFHAKAVKETLDLTKSPIDIFVKKMIAIKITINTKAGKIDKKNKLYLFLLT